MIGPILIVDDEPVNLATLRQILSTDHALVFARNGNEAWLRWTVRSPHHPSSS